MMRRDFLSDNVYASRILNRGKIEELPFSLPSKALFTIYIRPKGSNEASDMVVKARMINEKAFYDTPVFIRDWSPILMEELGETPGLLEDNDVYWGAGEFVYGNNS